MRGTRIQDITHHEERIIGIASNEETNEKAQQTTRKMREDLSSHEAKG